MTEIKRNDFIEIEYSGKTKEESILFDTTSEKEAKLHEVYDEKHKYEPIVICIGEHQIIKGIDESLIGKESGKEYALFIPPEDAFGKKNPQLIQLINKTKFKQHNINPTPGLQINMDGVIGTVKNVSGGRIMMDFNHPLSGKEVIYKVKVLRIVTNTEEKIKGFLKTVLHSDDPKVEIKEGKATITVKQPIPEAYQEEVSKKLKDLIKEVKEYKFIALEAKKIPDPHEEHSH
tara:strand:- start:732 stop:1427 length:696 start_codon:yes stop_codon:yes gene_type:complete